jgi:hypothetical protein
VDQHVTFLAGVRDRKLFFEPLSDIGITRDRFMEVNIYLGIFGKAVGAIIPFSAYQGINIAPLQF